ncbi:MAG: zinc ribbon domain-containing protein [bacterium]|nr:zinc ribbon domain-containing protein [bacterium]
MKCNNCGYDLDQNAKFCENCGSKIENDNSVSDTLTQKENLVQPEPLQNLNSNESVQENLTVDINEPVVDNGVYNETVDISTNELPQPLHNQVNLNNLESSNINNTSTSSKKSSNLMIWIAVLIIALVTVVGVFLLIALNKNSNSIDVLKKSIANLEEKSKDSGTVKLGVSASSGDSLNINLSGSVKFQKSNDQYNLALLLDKSAFMDAVEVYSTFSKENVSLYLKSDLIDSLGYTASENSVWLNYIYNIENTVSGGSENEKAKDVDIYSIIDNKHFKYIDEVNGVKHYSLIIDEELINKLAEELKKLNIEEVSSMEDVSSQVKLEKPLNVEFYINKSNTLEKIEADVSGMLDDESISKVILSMNFENLGSTIVSIPPEALNSNMDIMTYINENSMVNYDDFDYNYDDFDTMNNLEYNF